jgi:hypothetical protein
MTEMIPPIAAAPSEPARSPRRRIIVAIIAALVAAAGAYLGLQLLTNVLTTPASSVQSPAPTDASDPPFSGVYTSEAGAYSVEITYEPQVIEGSSAAYGPEYAKVQASWAVGTREYFIQVVEFPEDLQATTETILNDSVSGLVASTPGATLIEDTRIDFNGETAAVGVVEVPSGPARFVIVLHNYRQYLMIVSSEDGSSDEDFIDSFKFLD